MTRLVRDRAAIRNERIKLFAGLWNAVGLGLIAFAVLRPAVEDANLLSGLSILWAAGGVACHGVAHYIMGWLTKEADDDDA